MEREQADKIAKEYCEWANMRVEDGLMALVGLFPLQYRTFRLWLYHRHPDLENHTDELYRFLCEHAEYENN